MPMPFFQTFPAELSRISEMIRSVDSWSGELRLPSGLRQSLRLIVDEVASNICRYGSVPKDSAIILTLDQSFDTVTLEILDFGVPFNPLEQEESDISLPLNERPVGGLGIFLVRRLSKDLAYRRDGEKNILTVSFDVRET